MKIFKKKKKKKLTPYQIKWIDDRIHGSGGHRTMALDFFGKQDGITKKGELDLLDHKRN